MQKSDDPLSLRSYLLRYLREYLYNSGYIEVETPYLIPAPIPEAHIDSFEVEDRYLHTSPEAYMKLLLSKGYERIFQICKVFRKGEKGRFHMPEFTMIEWYRAGSDYMDLMDECERLLIHIFKRLVDQPYISYRGKKIGLNMPWERISLETLFNRYSELSLWDALKKGIFEKIMITDIEPHLGWRSPVFVYDYPVELGSCAMRSRRDPRIVERFELYMGSIELANGYTECNDPKELKDRFLEEIKKRQAYKKPIYPMPEYLLCSLKAKDRYSGIAMGIDRLIMLIADKRDIEDVISFNTWE